MNRSATFRYSIDAPCPAATAVSLLADPRRQVELHPLIRHVREVAPAPGAIASFAITDALALGPLRFRIVYDADVIEVSDHKIVTVARQKPATTVRNTTLASETATGVTIEVEITLTAPSLLFGYAYRTAHRAHLELGRRIEARLTELGASG